jgi:hypothetical protein
VIDKTQLEIKVDFYGLNTLQAALRKVAPDLQKELRRRTREPMARVQTRAKGLAHSARVPSGWDVSGGAKSFGKRGWGDPAQRGYSGRVVASGIRLRINQKTFSGISYLWTLKSESWAGTIYEFAASPRKPQGKSFVQVLNGVPTSRLVWRAWDELGGESVITPPMLEAINDVSEAFNRRAAAVESGDRIGL